MEEVGLSNGALSLVGGTIICSSMGLNVDGIYSYIVPLARTLAGFVMGLMFGICGGWAAITFNAMLGFPWALEVHRNIYIVGIGLGAGLGAYLGWVNVSIRRYWIVATVLLVLAAGVAGAYLGLEYGEIKDPSYLGRRYTIDNMMHWGAPLVAIVASTVLGIVHQVWVRER